MVAGTQWIGAGVEQGQDPPPLIVVHQAPDHRQARRTEHQTTADDLPGEPGKIQQIEARGADQQGRAEIGLTQDEEKGNQQQHCANPVMPGAQHRLVALEIPGEYQRQGNLEQLGRLERDHAQVQPAPRSVTDFTEQGDADQQHHARDIQRRTKLGQDVRRHVGNHQHDRQRQRDIDQVAADACRALSRGARHHRQADAEQCQHQQQQHAVEMAHPEKHPGPSLRHASHPVSCQRDSVPSGNSRTPCAQSAQRCRCPNRRFPPSRRSRWSGSRPAHRQ